jgi:phage shock protein PspC (stress-responsive transcriptional regulator)
MVGWADDREDGGMETTTPPSRFRRTNRDKVVAGVAGGLGRYLGVDPVVVRLLFAVAVFVGGIGVLAYVLAWVIVPSDDDPALDRGRPFALGGQDAGRVIGAAFVVLAFLALIGDHWWAGDLLFPAGLIAGGIWLLVRSDRPDDAGRPASDVPAPDVTTVGPATVPGTREHPAVQASWAPPPPQPAATRSGFPTARATTGVIALLAGGLGLAAANGADVSIEAILTACLAVCGAGLLVGAFVGRARALIALAIPLTFLLAATTAVDVPLEGGVGDRLHRPQSVAELEDEYRLGAGELVLDLRGLDADDLRGDIARVEVSIGAGAMEVFLPTGATVTGTARAQLGDVDVLGARSKGGDARRRIDVVGAEGGGRIELDLRVGLGEVVVR